MSEKNIKLVIAEKPSVAQSIEKVIGADKREDGYLEGNGYIVSWCVGHLVELASPESYDEKYEKWRYDDLPILPSQWNYQIAAATRKQFNILKKLMEREDVTGLCKAGERMAATKLIAMHQNKGRSVMQCLKDRTDYAMNGDKTEDGKYISSYQCNPELVDLEFAQAKKEYLHKIWRQPKGDVLAYQIRQSFKLGEITPEEANEVGYETGMRFTKGKHAFIVATHVDRAHIHNHIIFNSTNLNCDRKFRDFWFSGIALQRLSDIICLEHGLSIIPKVKPSERQRRTKYPERISMRDVIRENILKCLEQKPADFEELLKLLQQEGYEIKRGRQICIC